MYEYSVAVRGDWLVLYNHELLGEVYAVRLDRLRGWKIIKSQGEVAIRFELDGVDTYPQVFPFKDVPEALAWAEKYLPNCSDVSVVAERVGAAQ